jgi:guanylate kinase
MNKKYQVIAIIGQSGAGKDYFQNATCEMHPLMFHKIISCTTRPKRDNEKDGVDYHFIQLEDFTRSIINNKMLETTEFRNWFYGTPIESLSLEKINIGVFNPDGVKKLLQDPRLEVIVIEIVADDKIHLTRALTRQENPDCTEICRRFFTDKEDFANLDFITHTVTNNSDEQIQDIFNDEHLLFPCLEHMWRELDPGTAFETIVRWEKTMQIKSESEDDKGNID